MVYRAAYSVTGSKHDAQDIQQDVFVMLIDQGRTLEFTKNPAGYLFRMAINKALESFRKRKRRKETDDGLEPLLGVPSHGNPHQDDMRERLRLAIAKLEPEQIEILLLSVDYGYTDFQIAKMLGKTRNAVAVMLHRTRARLRESAGRKRWKTDETRRHEYRRDPETVSATRISRRHRGCRRNCSDANPRHAIPANGCRCRRRAECSEKYAGRRLASRFPYRAVDGGGRTAGVWKAGKHHAEDGGNTVGTDRVGHGSVSEPAFDGTHGPGLLVGDRSRQAEGIGPAVLCDHAIGTRSDGEGARAAATGRRSRQAAPVCIKDAGASPPPSVSATARPRETPGDLAKPSRFGESFTSRSLAMLQFQGLAI